MRRGCSHTAHNFEKKSDKSQFSDLDQKGHVENILDCFSKRLRVDDELEKADRAVLVQAIQSPKDPMYFVHLEWRFTFFPTRTECVATNLSVKSTYLILG